MISITANTLVNDRVDRTGEDAEAIAQAAWKMPTNYFKNSSCVRGGAPLF